MDIQQLRDQIRQGRVLVPGDDGYDETTKRWSQACEIQAAVVVQPVTAAETSIAIGFTIEHNLPLTVCGGGHSSSGASSSTGMVIHLGLMRSVEVDAPGMTVSFCGGCLWSDIDSALETHGLATVGGVVNHTGVGGLILGGGHGYLTPRHGLTIDNLLSAEVVLADGRIVVASATEHPDLFWAMRGAGAQFGVVTRFTSHVHPQEEVWSGTMTFAADKLPELVAVANALPDGENCLTIGINHSPDAERQVSAIPLYHGPESSARTFFAQLLSITALSSDLQMMTIAKCNTLLNPVFDHGFRRLMGPGNAVLPLSPTALLTTATNFWIFCEEHAMGPSAIAIELFPTAALRRVSNTATAYANRGNYFDAVTAFGWSDAGLDGIVRSFNRELCAEIRKTHGVQAGQGEGVGVYINIEADEVKPEDAYGANLERLRSVKGVYDPRNVFHKWHGVGASRQL